MSKRKKKQGKIRYNISIAIVYVLGIILLVKLFDLQVIHGAEYREESNTRLTRETTLKAARGNILDSSGNKLVTTTSQYNVEIYKTKIDSDALNNALLSFAKTLESNGDRYVDDFPIKVNPYAFQDGLDADSWKASHKIDKSFNAEQCFNYYKSRYKVNVENVDDARRIVALRYHIEKEGYSNTKSVQLATNISNASFAKLNEMGATFPGISTYIEPKVIYPYKTLASHILGYVGPISGDDLKNNKDYDQNDKIGKDGIERVFEKYLRGKDGTKQIDMSVDGLVTDEYVSQEAEAGDDVVLTIDAQLQKITEDALETTINDIREHKSEKGHKRADVGAAVVMNVKTGEVLAMASYPNYEPGLFIDGISSDNYNAYVNDNRNPLTNKAIADQSAPGSSFKMVTAIAGLESGAITPTTKINDTGRYTYYRDYQPYCWNRHGHGWQNVTQAIEHSCNYFFYDTGRRTGIDKLNETAKAFGLGSKTGIELPGEIAGILAGPETDKEWTGGKTIQAAIGQANNDFTPLQMAKYTAMIANGGKNLDVSIVKSINKSDGTQVSKNEIESFVDDKLKINGNSGSDLNVSENLLNVVKGGMRGVTSDDGTAANYFKNFNIEIGGKTGSASTDLKGNANAWFVGFAPFDDPEIAIAVYIRNGQHGGYAAPVAREIVAQYFGMNASAITENMDASTEEQTIN